MRSGLTLYLVLWSMSRYLWHSSKWRCRFGYFFQYMSGFEALAYSINTDFNYEIQPTSILNHQVAAICKGRTGFPNQFSRGILKDSNIIFSTEFKLIFSQCKGILEPKNFRDPLAPLAFTHSFSRQYKFISFQPLYGHNSLSLNRLKQKGRL